MRPTAPAKPRHFKLGWKLLSLFLAVGLTILVGAVGIFQGVVRHELNTVAAQELQANVASTRHLLTEERTRLTGLVSVFRNAQVLTEAIYYFSEAQDRGPITEALQTLFKKFSITFLLASDTQGRVAFRVHDPERYDDTIADTWLAKQGLQGEIGVGYVLGPHGLALRAGGPLMSEGDFVGYVEVGNFLDDAFAMNLKRLIQADVTFYYNEKALATSLSGDDRASAMTALPGTIQQALRRQSEVVRQESIQDAAYHSAYFTLENPADTQNSLTARVSINSGTIHSIERKIQLLALVLIVISAILMLVASRYFTAKLIVRPIQHMAAVASKIGAGDLNQHIDYRSRDEIGVLASGFNLMIQHLAGLVRQVQQAGIQVTASATQLAASGKQLESTVTEQMASTHQVVATTKEIAATSRQLAQTMQDVTALSDDTATAATSSHAGIGQMENTPCGRWRTPPTPLPSG